MNVRRILVVDDEPGSAQGTIAELKDRQFKVDHALTQQHAEVLLARNYYSALLLDLRLPRAQLSEPKLDPDLAENGLAVLKNLRRGDFQTNGTRSDCPVFIITGHGFESRLLDEALSLDVKQVFSKPETPLLVAETIRLSLEAK